MTSIYEHTQHTFKAARAACSTALQEISGKRLGLQHAALLYKQWMKKGELVREDPAFNNAQKLFDSICLDTDFSLPLLSKCVLQEDTVKFLLRIQDGFEIESVFLPMKRHNTLCVSSQVGCKMACHFCETGRMGLLRNLTAKEIVSQVYIARFGLKLDIHNIVFMGMGEPFDNYDAVAQAILVLTDQSGLAFGMNNITVSTSGEIAGIQRLANESQLSPNLAVSITSANSVKRTRLMPITRKYTLEALKSAMQEYSAKTNKQILIAYVLMKGINDALSDADELVHYLQGLDVKVNLIPYNAQAVDRYAPPDWETIEAFAARLKDAHMRVLLRRTKGDSIMAACGQLGKKQMDKKENRLVVVK